MKRFSLLVSASCILLAGFGCDSAKSDHAPSSVSQNTAGTTSPTKAKPDKEANCAATGDDASEHSGSECMKKSAEMAAAGDEQGCNKWDDAADQVAKRDVPADSDWNVLEVSGMSCGGCERRIIANVGELDGVVSVEADAELGKVRVAIAKGNATASEAAKAKILELGYTVQ